jgi:hypothetical protein
MLATLRKWAQRRHLAQMDGRRKEEMTVRVRRELRKPSEFGRQKCAVIVLPGD